MQKRQKRSCNVAAWWILLGALWATICLAVGARLALQKPLETDTALALTACTIGSLKSTAKQFPNLHLAAAYMCFSTSRFPRSSEPTILIYHTHTNEAYYPIEDDQYVSTSLWRTNDNTKNVCSVGE